MLLTHTVNSSSSSMLSDVHGGARGVGNAFSKLRNCKELSMCVCLSNHLSNQQHQQQQQQQHQQQQQRQQCKRESTLYTDAHCTHTYILAGGSFISVFAGFSDQQQQQHYYSYQRKQREATAAVLAAVVGVGSDIEAYEHQTNRTCVRALTSIVEMLHCMW
jgi:hypothetical protein